MQGQVGGRNYDYPHYSVYYDKNGGDATIGEHLSCSPGVRINFRDDVQGYIPKKTPSQIKEHFVKNLEDDTRINISGVRDYI